MPPKLSKAERKKREEEERKRLEEEARIRFEAEEKERLIREKEEERIRKYVEKEELKKRVVELQETRELFQEQRIRLEQLELERRNEYAWKRYFRCDGSPNPSIEKEVNTFMSLWDMDEKRISMEEVMDDSVQSLKLIDELCTLIADMGDNEEDNQTLTTYLRTMHELRQQVHAKLDRATIETLSRAVHYADHETSNLQKTWSNDWIVMCIWGNLSKNPRIRQFTFADVDITFDIPKFLTLSDCAFLITFMKFDNYSVECDSFTPKQVLKEQTHTADVDLIPKSSSARLEIETTTETKSQEEKETKEDLDLQVFLKSEEKVGVGAGAEEEEDATTEQEETIELPIEDRVPTPENEEWEQVEMAADAVDLGEKHVIGGVIRFDLLCLPRQPKSGRGWSITTCVRPPKLTPFEYTVDEPSEENQPTEPRESEHEANETKRKEERKDEHPPVQVKFRLPQSLVIAEEPVLAKWDPELRQWRTGGIHLEKFKEDENLIEFRTSVFGTMAVFQDFHINMPFQSWELKPLPMRKSSSSAHTSNTSGTNDYVSGIVEQPPIASVFSPPVYRSHGGAAKVTRNPSEVLKDPPSVSAVEGTTTEPSKEKVIPEEQKISMILGPVPTLGLSDEAYLMDLPETNQSILTITGGLIEIRLHILGDRISVLPSIFDGSPINDDIVTGGTGVPDTTEQGGAELISHHKRELTHLWGRWFTLDELIYVLQLSGVNIFPRQDSVCRVECLEKNPITEQRLYEQMALLSPALAFGWSRWNAECGDRNKFIVLAVEHLDREDSVDEDTWKVYEVTRKKVTLLKMKEYESIFDPTPDPKQSFHADFYHMFMDFGSEEGKKRVRKIDLKYLKTVKQLLQATRLPVFS